MRRQNPLRRALPWAQHNITLVIIVLNLSVFLINTFIPRSYVYMAMIPGLVNEGFVWSFLSYMFVHGNFNHILFNMIGLFIFGSQVEQQMGSWEFLLFYLVTGLLAGVLSYFIYLISGLMGVALVGASGAVYGIMLAFATYFPNATVFVMGIIPMRSVTLVLLYAAIAIFNQFTGSSSGVAHMTHLGGLVFAFLYFLIRLGKNPINSWRYRA